MDGNQANSLNPYVIPILIVFAGLIIAGAVLLSNGNNSLGNLASAGENVATHDSGFGNNLSAGAMNMRAVDLNQDHSIGSKEAKVIIVEYSDFECPFCSRLHPTLTRIVDEFPGEVAWVYRHFPLSSIHARALSASIASECFAELGGNDAFWEFADRVFADQRSLGDSLYTSIADDLGINKTAFAECVDSNRHQGRVQADRENAIASGGQGTPFSVVVTESGETFPFSGALPYEQVRQIVEAALQS